MRWLALALCLCGCGANASAKAPAQAVVVAPAPTVAHDEPTPAPSIFHCSPSRPIDRARITGAFSTDWSSLNPGGEAITSQKLQDVNVVYTISRLKPDTPERIEIVLERHDEGVPSGKRRAQDGWVFALDGGWIRQGVPFVVEHEGEAWCFLDQPPCPSPIGRQNTFLGLLGMTASLLVPLPQLTAQLDGKASDGKLSIELPDVLAIWLGVYDGKPAKVSAGSPGIPATFEVVVKSEQPGEWGPQPERTTSTARVQIDEACRIREASSIREHLIFLGPDTPGASRVVDRWSRRVDPAD